MKLSRFATLALLFVVSSITQTAFGQIPPADKTAKDGLLWRVRPSDGRSYPLAVKILQGPNSYIQAQGKLDRLKYTGYGDSPLIAYEILELIVYVTPLNAQGQPVAGAETLLRALGDNDTGNFGLVDGTKRMVKQGDVYVDQPFDGFPPGSYEVKAVAKIVLSTPEKQNPPPLPPTPPDVCKREAVLITNLQIF